MVLRSVRTQDEGAFTPHLALTVGMLLAFGCVGTLVYFMGHMAGRINVDTVIDLVGDDVRNGLDQLVAGGVQADPPAAAFWNDATVVTDDRRGYLQHLDEDGLADWAAAHGTVVRLLVRRGDFVFPGAPIAMMTVDVAGVREAIRAATSLGSSRTSSGDPEQAIRQLVEVGVRALSPGINDPHTAMSVLDRLGAALCDLAGRKLASGVVLRDGAVALVVPTVTYRTLTGVMFHMLRQNSRGSTAMYLKLLRILGVVVACESDPARRAMLEQHADQVLDDAGRTIANLQDLAAIRSSHSGLKRWLAGTALEALLDSPSTADD